jgi:hypothetical protein
VRRRVNQDNRNEGGEVNQDNRNEGEELTRTIEMREKSQPGQ